LEVALMIDDSSIFIVEVIEDGFTMTYQYLSLKHATEHYNNEQSATIYEYNKGNYYLVDAK
jgi:hypothetical protein